MLDERVGGGDPGRLLHLLVGGVQPSVADVLPHSAGKEVGILEHHGDAAPEKGPVNPLQGHAVNGDAPLPDLDVYKRQR